MNDGPGIVAGVLGAHGGALLGSASEQAGRSLEGVEIGDQGHRMQFFCYNVTLAKFLN